MQISPLWDNKGIILSYLISMRRTGYQVHVKVIVLLSEDIHSIFEQRCMFISCVINIQAKDLQCLYSMIIRQTIRIQVVTFLSKLLLLDKDTLGTDDLIYSGYGSRHSVNQARKRIYGIDNILVTFEE